MSSNINNICFPRCVNVINTFRQLWSEHVMWTRAFIVSSTPNRPDLDAVTNRLLRNPSDFAKALRKYYSEKKASTFEKLLTEHIEIAGQLLNAHKLKDSKKIEKERRKWYNNADEISCFLSSINPFWSKRRWQEMFYRHLKMIECTMKDRIARRYTAEIAMYQNIEDEALQMADMMAVGIIKQFRIK